MSLCLNDVSDLDNHDRDGKIGTMTMPDASDDTPRLSELVRIMQDFRQEFRHAMETVVRKDVYTAERAAVELQIVAVKQEIARVDRDIAADRNDRKNFNGKLTFAMITAGLGLLSNLILILVK